MNNTNNKAIKIFAVVRSGDGQRKIIGEFDREAAANNAAAEAATIRPGWVPGNRVSEGFHPYYYEVVPSWRSSKFGPPSNQCHVLV